MTYHVPKVFYNPNLEQITTPNKNIQSYFMKSDNSYFVKESEKFINYKSADDNLIVVCLTPDDLIIGTSTEDYKILTRNKSKYSKKENSVQPNEIDNNEIQKNLDSNEGDNKNDKENIAENIKDEYEKSSLDVVKCENLLINQNFVKENSYFFDFIFNGPNFNKEKLSSIQHLQNLVEKSINDLYKIENNSFVVFVFNEMLNRTELLSMVDLFLIHLDCKGILLLPCSLTTCFMKNTSSATVVRRYEKYTSISFIEDYCYIDANKIFFKDKKTELFYSLGDEDFAEEFTKQDFKVGFTSCICKFCKGSFEKENIVSHIKRKHKEEINEDIDENLINFYEEKRENKAEIQESLNLTENIKNLFKNNFVDERAQKIAKKIILQNADEKIKIDKEIINSILFGSNEVHIIEDNDLLSIFKGGLAFSTFDCSKECWLTDKEWENGRLRILKEKLLFFI